MVHVGERALAPRLPPGRRAASAPARTRPGTRRPGCSWSSAPPRARRRGRSCTSPCRPRPPRHRSTRNSPPRRGCRIRGSRPPAECEPCAGPRSARSSARTRRASRSGTPCHRAPPRSRAVRPPGRAVISAPGLQSAMSPAAARNASGCGGVPERVTRSQLPFGFAGPRVQDPVGGVEHRTIPAASAGDAVSARRRGMRMPPSSVSRPRPPRATVAPRASDQPVAPASAEEAVIPGAPEQTVALRRAAQHVAPAVPAEGRGIASRAPSHGTSTAARETQRRA